ncbi:MAG: hypothetical protein AAGB31_02625, partial [Bdellovibrio sp.]
WSLRAAVSDMYSTTTSFQSDDNLQNADPLIFALASPYKIKTSLFNRPYSLTLTPGFESLFMNADGEGSRENSNTSYYFNIENSFSQTDKWIGNYSLDLRQDNSFIDTQDIDDQTALKVSLSTTQIFILQPKASENLILDAAVIDNAAQGDNQKYLRINAGLTYTHSFFWDTQAAAQIALGTTKYPDHSSQREDQNYGFTLSASKNLSTFWNASLSAGWSHNNSNVDVYSYDKLLISNIYTFTGAF